MTNPEISVVVCTYNRAAMLRDAITSLVALKTNGLFRYDILVVDNASTDTTADVVAEISENADVIVRRVLEEKQGVVPARNRGVAEANGTWIAFFDDAQLADDAWLLRLWETAHE
ncbi:MAG: glycosyltransferase family 2 protein, partial [Planctomycetes bacterium]|nr:glycosyltransferase family 2 protein [Planctomycetota bacterium]